MVTISASAPAARTLSVVSSWVDFLLVEVIPPCPESSLSTLLDARGRDSVDRLRVPWSWCTDGRPAACAMAAPAMRAARSPRALDACRGFESSTPRPPRPAEPRDPHPRAVGNERRVHCHDAGARLGLGERRGQPVVELPVFRAAGDVARHREAPPPGLHPEEGRLLGRGEDALVAARHGGERAARALRAPPTVTEVARERRRVPALRARHRGEPHARHQQAPRARRAPPACNAKPRAVVPEPLQLERIDDDGGSPVVAHGMARLLDGTRYQATAMPGANLRGRGGRRSSV